MDLQTAAHGKRISALIEEKFRSLLGHTSLHYGASFKRDTAHLPLAVAQGRTTLEEAEYQVNSMFEDLKESITR